MKKKYSLKRNFARVLTKKVYSGGGLSIFAVPGRGLIGIAVGKKVKGAVKRNRIKRHLREYARRSILGQSQYKNKDVVLVAADPKFSKKEIKVA